MELPEIRSLEDLRFDPKNPNRGTDRGREVIAGSLDEIGFGRSVLTARDGTLIAGNQTARVALEQGRKRVLVVDTDGDELVVVRRRDLDPADPRVARAALLDNRASQLGCDLDQGRLSALLREGKLPRAAFTTAETRRILGRTEVEGGDEGEDADEDEFGSKTTRRAELGQLWRLGDHRLMVGDSFSSEDRGRLLEGLGRVDAAVTDPPYAIYGSASGISSEIADDKMVRPFFERLGHLLAETLREFGHAYVHCDWRSYATLWVGLRSAGLSPKNCIVWDKGSAGLGSSYANTHEFVAFFARLPPERAMTSGRKRGQRLVNAANVFHAQRPRGEERQHNAAKPVSLLTWLIENSTDKGEVVADWFCGSGSTIVAAHAAGRRCAAMELEPRMADVALARWERFAGAEAELA